MEKLTIKNRKDQNIAVLLDRAQEQKGLAFVMHGLGGFKEQDHIDTFASAFRDRDFTVVRFDTTNTLGESDGKYEDATITNYYEDLEDVIEWARTMEWYQEPFALSGHSLGGICTALYAQKYPERVSLLAPISPVVSGALSMEAHIKSDPDYIAEWEKTGWRISESRSKPGVVKRLPWSHMLDRLEYDLLPKASLLNMPVLLIVGEADDVTTPEHIEILFNALPGPKEFHVIQGAPHTFRDEAHLNEIKSLFLSWIDKYL